MPDRNSFAISKETYRLVCILFGVSFDRRYYVRSFVGAFADSRIKPVPKPFASFLLGSLDNRDSWYTLWLSLGWHIRDL